MGRWWRLVTPAAACAVMACGCSTDSRSYMTEVHGGVWENPVVLELPNADTVGLYDLRIALRHDGSLDGHTVGMRVRTVTPDSLWIEEPLTMTVAADGRSRSAQHEAGCIYRRRVRLAKEGTYRITVAPLRSVSGVSAVGVEMAPEHDAGL